MPLPPALLKRLANRGLVNKAKSGDILDKSTQPENEEIIAEDYDEMEDPSAYEHYEPVKKPQENLWIERMKSRMGDDRNVAGFRACPNKYNIFHKCTVYCVNRWGDGIVEPSREYMIRKKRLLAKYPLPKHWQEVYDFGCGCYYFWNAKDDTVSWLPPYHPKSEISKSAAALRRELEEILPPNAEEEDHEMITDKDLDEILNLPLHPPRKRADSPEAAMLQPIKKSKNRDLDKVMRQSRRNRDYSHSRYNRKGNDSKDADPLDPMDPASYSDIPRGKWSDGLNVENPKTGVDSTATGSLFQMRPYPSPGAILQANSKPKAIAGRDNDDNQSDGEGEDI